MHSTQTGHATDQQRQRIVKKQEKTKGAAIEPVNETVAEAQARHPRPETAYDNSTGERAIDHGANQESEHRKRRVR